MKSPSVIVAVVLSLNVTSAFAQFPDVASTHPYAAAIEYAETEGFMWPFEDGTFRPNQLVSRAELTQALVLRLYRASSLDNCFYRLSPESDFTLLFNDVPKDAKEAKELCMALQTGLVSGYPDGTFQPDRIVNFAEASKIITRAYRLAPLGKIYFQNLPWYHTYVRLMLDLKAVPPNIENPAHQLTRAEVAEILYRLRDDRPTGYLDEDPMIPEADVPRHYSVPTRGGTSTSDDTPPTGSSIGSYHQNAKPVQE